MFKTIKCPSCGKSVEWKPASKWRPFCSERCRLIDLGEWLDEGHRISEPLQDGFDPDLAGPEGDGERGSHEYSRAPVLITVRRGG